MGAVKLGPFKIGKDKTEVKAYKFFVNDGKVGGREENIVGQYFAARYNLPAVILHLTYSAENLECFACVARVLCALPPRSSKRGGAVSRRSTRPFRSSKLLIAIAALSFMIPSHGLFGSALTRT